MLSNAKAVALDALSAAEAIEDGNSILAAACLDCSTALDTFSVRNADRSSNVICSSLLDCNAPCAAARDASAMAAFRSNSVVNSCALLSPGGGLSDGSFASKFPDTCACILLILSLRYVLRVSKKASYVNCLLRASGRHVNSLENESNGMYGAYEYYPRGQRRLRASFCAL